MKTIVAIVTLVLAGVASANPVVQPQGVASSGKLLLILDHPVENCHYEHTN